MNRRTVLAGIVSAPFLIGNAARAAQEAGLPPTLAGSLETTYWNARERGPLLVVAPERAVAWRELRGAERLPEDEVPAPPGKPGANGYPFYAVAPYYARKVVPVGGMSAVVPVRMATLRPDYLTAADLSAGLSDTGRVVLLLSGLDEKQWRLVMGAGGVGRGDLKQAQRAVWDSVFGSIRITRIAPPAPGEEYEKRTTLPALPPDQIRLRVFRELGWRYLQSDSRSVVTSSIGGGPVKAVSHTVTFQAGVPDGEFFGRMAYGVPLLVGEPNRSKPSDMNYAAPALDTAVPLADARTVEDLMARIRTATRLEIHADPRYRELAVHSRTAPGADTVRAGDLLKAIAYSVTGTVRRLADGAGAVYVLTDDCVGLGTRHAVIADWLRIHANTLENAQRNAYKGFAAAREANPYLWTDREGFVPSAALREKLAGWESSPVARTPAVQDHTVPISELPSGAQETVRDLLTQNKRRRETRPDPVFNRPLREDVVLPNSSYRFAVSVPGVGEINITETSTPGVLSAEINEQWSSSGRDAGTPLPVRLSAATAPMRAISVTARSAEDAREAARLCVARNFNRLYLDVPTDTPAKVLQTWIASATAAADSRVSVYLCVSPFWTAAGTGESDRNRLNETWQQFRRRRAKLLGEMPDAPAENLLSPGDAATRQAFLARLQEWARLPGVRGVALTGTPPPGYTRSDTILFGDEGTTFWESGEFGFTMAARLAFLRENGVDPVDLSPTGMNTRAGRVFAMSEGHPGALHLPFFPDYGPDTSGTRNDIPLGQLGAKTAYVQWDDFRMQPVWEWRKAVAEAVGAVGGDGSKTELLVETEAPGARMLLPWSDALTKPTPPITSLASMPPLFYVFVPVGESAIVNGVPQSELFARQSAPLLYAFRAPTIPIGTKTAKPAAAARPSPKVGGFLINLREVPLAQIETLLKNIVIEP